MQWKVENNHLVKTYKLSDFVSCVEFLGKVSVLAEELHHHPDVEIKDYNKITFRLITHDANTITEKDHELSRKIDEIEIK